VTNITEMVKKGKYKLFSYFIEKQIIFYKSLKKKPKMLAFAIFEFYDFNSIEQVLDDFLRKQIIRYFSIQINTEKESDKIILLNFEDINKENIIKSFNFVKQEIKNGNVGVRFFKDDVLEKRFATFFDKELNSKVSHNKDKDSIVISDTNNSKILNFYTIDLDLIEKKESFILSFITLINNFGKEGFIIFYFFIDHDENIKLSPYFIIKSNINEDISRIEKEVNNFFHGQVLIKLKIKIDIVFNFFWRLGIKNEFFLLKENYNIFSINKKSHFLDLSEINDILENKLIENHIEYVRINKNLLFIEQNFVFFINQDLDSDYVYRIIDKYLPKYYIYILILNKQDYLKLLNINSINLIENVKIINPNEIQKFNILDFKNEVN
jgi:hypothetical protein